MTKDIEENLILHPENCARVFDEITSPKNVFGEINSSANTEEIDSFIASIDDPNLRAKIISSMPISNGSIRRKYYSQIEDRFLKACVTINDSKMDRIYRNSIYGVDIEQLVQCSEQVCSDIDVYIGIKQRLEDCKDDDERVSLITSPDFFDGVSYKLANDIKHSTLSSIQGHDLRMKIINSMENRVLPELAELNECAQEIILNFFEKVYDGKIPDDRMEKLLLVLKKYDVQIKSYDKTSTLGECEYVKNLLSLKSDEFSISNVATLVHEYLHAMVEENRLFEPYEYDEIRELEEGMADTFSDMALNMYIRENSEFLRRFGIEEEKYRYVSESGYNYENSIVRTLLYPLEKEQTDMEAIAEFALGQRNEFLRMILPEDIIENLPKDEFGRSIFNSKLISMRQLYEINRGKYLNLNRESLYCSKNNIIGEFEKYNSQVVEPKSDKKSSQKTKWKIFGADDDEVAEEKPIFSVWEDRFEDWYHATDKMPESAIQKQEVVDLIQELDQEKDENQIEEQR